MKPPKILGTGSYQENCVASGIDHAPYMYVQCKGCVKNVSFLYRHKVSSSKHYEFGNIEFWTL